jgi:ABC-type Na+ efflux pump permease subunit
LLTRREWLDYIRERSTLISAALQALILVLAVELLPGFLDQYQANQSAHQIVHVAVQGTTVPALVRSSLSNRRYRSATAVDARQAVLSKKAQVGLVVPPAADATIAAGGSVVVEEVLLATSTDSRTGAGAVDGALTLSSITLSRQRLQAQGLDPQLADLLGVDLLDPAHTLHGSRVARAPTVADFAMIMAAGIATTAAARIAGAKRVRAAEALLLLPIRRRTLAAGLLGGLLAVGTFQAAVFSTAIVTASYVKIGQATPAQYDAGHFTALFLLTIVLLSFMASAGLFVATWARSAGLANGLAGGVNLAATALGFGVLVARRLPGGAALSWIPMLGPDVVMRDLLAGRGDVVAVVVALASSAVAVTVLLRGVGAQLATDKAVLRAAT